MRQYIKPGATVLDIGANIGLHSLLAAHLAGPTGRVHAFEPDPQSLRFLLENVRINEMENVTVWSVALSDREDVAEIHIDLKTARATSMIEGHQAPLDEAPRQKLMVAATTLDALSLGEVDFAKIDVEGAELAVLSGARRLIEDSRPVVVIEVGAGHADLVHEYFHSLDYVLSEIQGNTVALPG